MLIIRKRYMSVALFKRYYLEVKVAQNAYSAGLSTNPVSSKLWQDLCGAFSELNPEDPCGVCRCGGELFWTKKKHSWAAICNICRAEEFQWAPPAGP